MGWFAIALETVGTVLRSVPVVRRLLPKGSAETLRLDAAVPRDRLKREGRILFVDDERPDLIDFLEEQGFNVRYLPDVTRSNLHVVEGADYDVLILDFYNVGTELGDGHGLELLRHVKRVNPRLYVLAYTSKLLGTEHAEFFRDTDDMLKKDLGLQDTLVKVEGALAKALSPSEAWAAVLERAGVPAGTAEDRALQKLAARAQRDRQSRGRLKDVLSEKTGGGAVGEVVDLVDRIARLTASDDD